MSHAHVVVRPWRSGATLAHERLTLHTLSFEDHEAALALGRHLRAAHRLRLVVPALIGNPDLARELEAKVGAQPGVTAARANPRSGRVLVHYAPDAPILDVLDRAAEAPRPRLGLRDRLRRRRAAPPAPTAPTARAPDAGWHAVAADEVARRLGVSPRQGLSAAAVRQRLHDHGPNAVGAIVPRSRAAILREQLDPATIVLLSSSLIALLLGDWLDATAIAVVIGVNGFVGYRLERKSEELLASWQRLEAGTASVIRDGAITEIPATELVPGDVLVFRAGDVVPADARVLENHRVTVDEATLTGESEPVDKTTDPVALAAPLGDRRSMLWKGTTVASGHGRAVVVATGAATELARVRALVEEARAPGAPLQRRLADLGRRVMWAGLGAAGLTTVAGALWRRPPLQLLRNAVALGVAAIPEGLPVTATAALVRSMHRMRDAGMVVRRLATTEALGGVTVVCADKTGTLTENAMRLERVELDGEAVEASVLRADPDDPLGPPASRLLAAAVLNSDLDYHQNRNGELELSGSATEQAITRGAEAAGLDPKALRRRFPRRLLAERRAGVHYVVSLHDGPDGTTLAFIKGAPEQVLPRCRSGPHGLLDDRGRDQVVRRNLELAGAGHRVLAVGWQQLRGPIDQPPDDGWIYLGLVALRDPLRRSAADAVHAAGRAGVRTVILTGDQLATAEAIGRDVGLTGLAVEGQTLIPGLAAGDPAALDQLDRTAVIARVTPADKVAIVEALRRRGHVVAMAGDGVNDAAALKVADVGIAVGAGSADLARHTADVVLEHEDLRSILTAIGEGRIVQDNLRRAARYLFATNLAEVVIVLGGAVFGREPLGSLQLLWINLLADTMPAVALALEPGDPGVLDRPPAPPGRPLLDRHDWRVIARDGLGLAALAGLTGAAGPPGTTFGAVAGSQFGYVTAQRPDRRGAGRFAALVGGGAALQLLATSSAGLRRLLRVPSGGAAAAGFGIALTVPLLAGLWSKRDEIVVAGTAPGGPP